MKFLRTFFAALLACITASLLSFFVWGAIIIAIIASAALEGDTQIEKNSILIIDLNEPILDSPTPALLSSFDFSTYSIQNSLSLLNVLGAIEIAATDDNIKGILISPSTSADISTANLEEIRAALDTFHQSGKFIISFAAYYTQRGYYLSSVADEIYLEPEGIVDWRGMASPTLFYKGLLDKMDISIEAIRPAKCRYKSAVEPFIRKNMSPENREQMQSLIDSYWGSISSQVALCREMSEEQMAQATDNLDGFFAQEALESGLIDGIIYHDQLEEIYSQWGVETNAKGRHNTITLSKYVGTQSRTSTEGKECVAIIYAEGDIYGGENISDGVYSDSFISLLRRAKSDESVLSVVLRINSPGGDALAADAMWREVELLRAEKPVVVSMGAQAASGGYYIAAPADVILADRTTITGSIGVFGLIPSIGEALNNKLGVTSDVVKSNPMADFASPLNEISSAERRVLQRRVDNVYDKFTQIVSDGRNLPLEDVMEIAQGRVWSGEQALEIGLVDALGGLGDAIAIAASKGGLGDNFAIKEITHEPQGIDALLMLSQAAISSAVSNVEKSELKSIYKEWEQTKSALSPIMTKHGVVMYSPYEINID